ncbi:MULTISPECIES: MFS transporter [unclassified Arthrobacter]|uniref:MFS transporter n=1 Tax=unclassified Arthrobacter TaxID=235627 RepID=UPI001E376AFE|nr:MULTISPECIES: MFS transporter [unclassified Arthrobacter]MCC9146025.1 MFS transporter [Arthrobacter sp. zg-Y919]MDK1277254.1 MFS transporter [Arthrobacter sp. zg.Y919]WIB03766.1 MFS transporter [Arthrobacter sp. zg-Y919]
MSVTNALPTGDQVVQNLPWRWRVQGKIFLIGGLGFMFDAWDVTLNGILIPLLSKEWDLAPAQAAWIGTANLLGMAIGAFVWGSIADAIGRKRAFSATLLVFSIFTVLGAFSPDIVWFCVFRFMAGFGLGGCVPVDYALVGEFTPKKQRGRVLTGMDGWWPVGAALCGVTSAVIMATFADWRYTMLVMVIPAFLVFWVRRSVPESPLYLVRKGRTEEATAVIDDLVRRTGGTQTEWTLPEPQAPEKLSLGTMGTQLADLWRFSTKTTIAAWSLFLTILLVYYLALQWMPKILVDAGFAEYRAFLTTSGMAAVGLLGVVAAALLVEKVGRKWILAVTGPLSAAILVVVALVVDVPTAATIWLLVYGFVVQVAIPVLYAYVSELYPTHLRGSGFGWASTISRIGAGFGPLIFVSVLWPYLGLPMSFALAGILVLLAVLWMARFAPETKGAALD